jgi:hypothetical protein
MGQKLRLYITAPATIGTNCSLPRYGPDKCKWAFADNKNEGNRAMWISLFTVASGIAVCLSVAAVMMQPATQRTLRG